MAQEVDPAKPAGKGALRVVRKDLGKARQALGGPDRDEAVHEARKRLKQVRAILRLARQELGGAWRKEDRRYRDVARPLSEARDARVMVECVDKLREAFRAELGRGALARLRADLHARYGRVADRALRGGAALREAGREVARGQRRIESFRAPDPGWAALGPGLCKTYRAGRRAMRAAARRPEDEALHAWRKQAKYLRHQLELLRPAWPEALGPLAEQAKALGDRLGDDHDLAVLAGLLRGPCRKAGTAEDRRLALGLIAQRRAELQAEAFRLGRRLYAERPRDFTARLGAYWRGAGSA